MIKLTVPMKDGKRTMVLFGLARKNCEMLLENKPIMFEGDELGFPQIQFVIMGGESEQTMMEKLKSLGFKIP